MTTVLTAYTAGYEFGRLWAGILLLVAGGVALGFGIWLVRRRRQPDALPAAALPLGDTWTPDTHPETRSETETGVASDASDVETDDIGDPGRAELLQAQPASGSGRRVGGTVLLVVGVVLLAAGLLRTVPTLRDDLSRHTVTVPATAGSLQKVQPSAQMQQLLEDVPNQLSNVGEITNVQAGAYAESGSTDPVAYLIVAEVAGAPDPDEYFKGASSAFEQSNSGLALKEVDTAGLPGQMRCAELPTSVGMCLWLDSDTLGVVIRGSGASQSAVDVANTLRAAAEN